MRERGALRLAISAEALVLLEVVSGSSGVVRDPDVYRTALPPAEAAQEAPAVAVEVEAGLAAADPAGIGVEDVGGQVGEAVDRRAPPDVLLADQLVGFAVVAGEAQLVADDAAAERPDRDEIGRAAW